MCGSTVVSMTTVSVVVVTLLGRVGLVLRVGGLFGRSGNIMLEECWNNVGITLATEI